MDYTERDHLDNKSEIVTQLYEKLIDAFHAFGKIGVEPKKTSIHIVNRYAFAGVYTRKNYIVLEFHLSRKLDSQRIQKIEQGSVNRFHHSVKLEELADIDSELLSWMREAYELKS